MNEKIKEKLKMKIAISQMQEKEKITIKENEKNQKFKICKNTREGEKDEMNKKEKFVIKNIGIAVCTLMSLSGVVFAGNKVIETIWKEPEKIKFSEEITEEVRRENISKQEAEQKAVEMLEKFCFSTNIIKTKEMKDPISDEITYVFYTDDEYEVQITGRDGISYTITDNKIRKKDDSKKITEEEAKKRAEEYCNKYGINLQEYELTQIWSNNPEGSGKGDGNNICMTYSKKYDGIMNELREKKNTNLQYFISMDLQENSNGIYSQKQLIAKGKKLLEEGNRDFIDAKINNKKMGIMLFTSGTTSISKAVMLSHENVVTNVMDITHAFDLTENDRLLSFLPLHHVFECTVGFLYPIAIGASIAFGQGVKHMSTDIKELNITAMISVPAVYDIVYKKIMRTIKKNGKLENVQKGIKLTQLLLKVKIDLRGRVFKEVHENLGPTLKLVVTGGAALDPETEKGFEELGFDLVQGYGLTETSPVIAAETPKSRRLGSIGKKFNSVEVKIDNPSEDGVGELMAKGPSVMLGYYNNDEATKEALEPDGWFHTGDLARIDKDGYIYICGRKKNVIVLSNGKNVFPEEIETLLNKVEGIKESFVYEREEADGDPRVCVKLVYDKDMIKELYNIEGEENIKEFLWEKVKEINKLMPKYKYVKEMIITEEPLIKTTTLKVKRHEELKKILGK